MEKQETPMSKLDLLILAAGRGERLKKDIPKQFLTLCNKPIMIHTLDVFEALPYVGTKIITAAPEYIHQTEDLLSDHNITNFKVIAGGKTRAESVRNGLVHISTERVITHNAVCPFVTETLVQNVVKETYDCVTTVTPLEYNLCKGDDFADHIVERHGLMLINSPQTFKTQCLRDCHERAAQEGYVPGSDCELMLHYGRTVRFVPGSVRNFKITTPLDLLLAEAIMKDPSLLP